MRLRHPDGSVVHLAYCTNVHPADDLDGVLAQLRRFAGRVRDVLGVPRLGVGLWLSAEAAAALVTSSHDRHRLRRVLETEALEVVTLNGFPYGAFHADVVKLDVYEPDWADRRRLQYTRNLAEVLADLLPDDAATGSISTLPFAWRDGWTAEKRQACRRQLVDLAGHLEQVEERTGRLIRVGIEPEPGCIVETMEQAVEALQGLPTDRLGLCVDTCHAAVQFEDVSGALAAAGEAGISVVKSQLACALHVERPADPISLEALAEFDEPRFLHQTRVAPSGAVLGVDDLPAALGGELPTSSPWRVHFHSAIDAAGDGPVRATRDVLDRSLDTLVGGASCLTTHLEVETYTWSVLPADRRPSDDKTLVRGLAREIAAARDALVARGLEEVA